MTGTADLRLVGRTEQLDRFHQHAELARVVADVFRVREGVADKVQADPVAQIDAAQIEDAFPGPHGDLVLEKRPVVDHDFQARFPNGIVVASTSASTPKSEATCAKRGLRSRRRSSM